MRAVARVLSGHGPRHLDTKFLGPWLQRRQDRGVERDAALEMLRKESVELALAAASRLMGESLDQAKDRELVERYLSQLGDSGAQA